MKITFILFGYNMAVIVGALLMLGTVAASFLNIKLNGYAGSRAPYWKLFGIFLVGLVMVVLSLFW